MLDELALSKTRRRTTLHRHEFNKLRLDQAQSDLPRSIPLVLQRQSESQDGLASFVGRHHSY